MRILQLAQKPQRRGAEIFAHQLSCQLESWGHRCRIAYLYPHSGGVALDLRPGDVVLGGRERSPLEKFPGFHPRLLAEVRRWIARERPEIVQVNGARSVKYGALARRGDRGASWRLIYRNTGDPLAWIRGPLRRWFYRYLVLPRIEAVVGVSSTTLARLGQLVGRLPPSLYIPRAIEPERLVPRTGGPEQVRAELATPLEAPVVLFAASLAPEKRPDRLLRVAERIRGELPSLCLWVAGDGRLREQTEALARESFPSLEVRFLGAREDVATLMSAANLVLLPSDTEGIPGVLLEAGWLERAVVATRVGGVEECVRDGETGLLFDAGDEAGLAEGAMALLRDPERRARMGRRAKEWVSREFLLEPIARRYVDFYRRVLEQRG